MDVPRVWAPAVRLALCQGFKAPPLSVLPCILLSVTAFVQECNMCLRFLSPSLDCELFTGRVEFYPEPGTQQALKQIFVMWIDKWKQLVSSYLPSWKYNIPLKQWESKTTSLKVLIMHSGQCVNKINCGHPYSLSKTCFHQCFCIRFLSASFKELEKRCNLCSTAALHKITFLCLPIFLYSLLLCSLSPQCPSLSLHPTGPYFVRICSLPFFSGRLTQPFWLPWLPLFDSSPQVCTAIKRLEPTHWARASFLSRSGWG